MVEEKGADVGDLSSKRIVGFACNQGFALFLFYMGPNVGLGLFERADLFFMLAAMTLGFGVLWRANASVRDRLFARPLLFVYAAAMAGASLAGPSVPFEQQAWWLPVQGALLGIPNALLLAAWGRSFGQVPTATSVPEVVAGSFVGAVLCLVFSLAQGSDFLLLLRLLPFISAGYISAVGRPDAGKLASSSGLEERGTVLSAKVIVGTFCFGVAAGFMDAFATVPGEQVAPDIALTLVLFGAFLAGALSLLLSDGSYRVAVFVMALGFLLVPLMQDAVLPMAPGTVVFAGYLGLQTVLIALFLVVAQIARIDTSEAFSHGFTALFGGEAIGVLVANGFNTAGGETSYLAVVVSGGLLLLSFIFLFSERDFAQLSEISEEVDAFEAACARIVEAYGLSARESEILVYALRGRTSERIASELFISKSTVDTHLRRIYGKCDVHSRQELLDLGEAMRRN